jgi:hypothetical protein
MTTQETAMTASSTGTATRIDPATLERTKPFTIWMEDDAAPDAENMAAACQRLFGRPETEIREEATARGEFTDQGDQFLFLCRHEGAKGMAPAGFYVFVVAPGWSNICTVFPPGAQAPAAKAKAKRNPGEIVIERYRETMHRTMDKYKGQFSVWEPLPRPTTPYPDAAAALKFIRDLGEAGRFRIIAVKREVTVAVEQTKSVRIS